MKAMQILLLVGLAASSATAATAPAALVTSDWLGSALGIHPSQTEPVPQPGIGLLLGVATLGAGVGIFGRKRAEDKRETTAE